MCNIAELLMRITKLIVIHGFIFTVALEHVLKESTTLGMHTGIVHFFLGNSGDGKSVFQVTKYVWMHQDCQPWGQPLPIQCPECGAHQKWLSVQHRDGSYSFECGYRRCGYDGDNHKKPTHSWRVKRPEGAVMMKCHGSHSAWMQWSVTGEDS